jgi:hypothetical protein
MGSGAGISLGELINNQNEIKKSDKKSDVRLLKNKYSPSASRRMTIGILIMLLSTFSGIYFYNKLSATVDVLVTSTKLHAGQIISVSDLAISSISDKDSFSYIPASNESNILGKTVAYSLPAGSVLNYKELGQNWFIPQGFDLVGIALKTGQYPFEGLYAGKHVALIVAPSNFSLDQSDQLQNQFSPGEILYSDALVVSLTAPQNQSTSNYSLLLTIAVPSPLAGGVELLSESGNLGVVSQVSGAGQ